MVDMFGAIADIADVFERRACCFRWDAALRGVGGVRQHDRAHTPRREVREKLLRTGTVRNHVFWRDGVATKWHWCVPFPGSRHEHGEESPAKYRPFRNLGWLNR